MQEILSKARALMDAHGLEDWVLEASRSKTIAGACYPTLKKIALSSQVLPLWPDEEVTDTILHECAHALTPNDPGHGSEWRAMCRKIGARPDRTYEGELSKLIPKKWSLTCQCGGADRYKVHRRSKGRVCSKCKGDIQYYLTGEDKSSAAPFGVRYDYKVALFANEHQIEYNNGAWWAPEGMTFAATGTTYLEVTTDWEALWEDMSQGLDMTKERTVDFLQELFANN